MIRFHGRAKRPLPFPQSTYGPYLQAMNALLLNLQVYEQIYERKKENVKSMFLYVT